MAALLVTTGTAGGALAGFALGVVGGVVAGGGVQPGAVAALVLAAVLADMSGQRPWSIGRQVPREWSALFAPPTVAVLYGARLGVGPLTILPTWLWWAAALAAAAFGPLPSALAGAVFGAVRLLAVLAVAELARPDMPTRIAGLRAAERLARMGLAGAALALAGGALLV